MTERDDKLARAYRGLAREEPSSALDASILAASRSALRPRSASRRWAVPVSIAAVLVLAVGVTLEMQREQPGIETSAPAAGSIPPRAVAPQPAPLPQAEAPVTPVTPVAPEAPRQARERASPKPQVSTPGQKLETIAPQRKDMAEPAMREEAAPAPKVAPAAPQAFPPTQVNVAPPPAPPATAADTMQPAAESQSLKRMAPAGAAAAKVRAARGPEAELEHIAELRAQGHHAEADKALEEFKRAYPDYRIPDATWERVKPR
jgi:hypothetical protein